ncbi:hypothetical protein [Methylobacterium oryzisoli]|uniref:hypothetical protein n=1 Tax=Methylobacterium oryzisoli TaxID=3385502 RepID=UPI00389184F2
MPVPPALHSIALAALAGLLLAGGGTALADQPSRDGYRAVRAAPAPRDPLAGLLKADDDSDNSKRPELPPSEQDKADETGGPDRVLLR